MEEIAEDDRPTLPYGSSALRAVGRASGADLRVEEHFFAAGPAIARDDDDDVYAWWIAQRRAGLVRWVAFAFAVAFALGVVSAFR